MTQTAWPNGAPNLADFWVHDYPHLAPRGKRQLIVSYAGFLAELAAQEPEQALPLPPACAINSDAAGTMFRVDPGTARARRSAPLLAPLLAWFWVASSRSERFRFLRAFGGKQQALRRWDLTELEREAFDYLRRGWADRVRATSRGGNGYRQGRTAGFACWRREDSATEAALAALLPDPDQAYVGAQLCKPGSRNHTARVELAGQAYLLKRYNCRGWLYRLQNALRPSRALKNWALLHHFRLRGLAVPRPYLALEERRWRLLGRSYILMGFCPGQTLRQLWPALSELERRELIAILAILLGRMHRFGLLHGDLKWDNILVQRGEGRLQIRLIDFDGACCIRRPSRRRAARDLRRFLRDLRGNDAGGRWEARFRHGWSAWLAQLP